MWQVRSSRKRVYVLTGVLGVQLPPSPPEFSIKPHGGSGLNTGSDGAGSACYFGAVDTLMETCGVRSYRAARDCQNGHGSLVHDCEECRIGCFEPGRFKNPFYPDGPMFNYAEYLCAEHYDEVMDLQERHQRGTLDAWEEVTFFDED